SPFDPAQLAAATRRLEPLRAQVVPRFVDRLGLTAAELEALLVVAAPSIDPPLADLFAAVRGSAMARRGVDLALSAQLGGIGRARRVELLGLLDEERPPIACRLVQVAPAHEVYSSAGYRSIQPTLDLLWLLSGGEGPSPSLQRNAVWARSAATWDDLIFDEPA